MKMGGQHLRKLVCTSRTLIIAEFASYVGLLLVCAGVFMLAAVFLLLEMICGKFK